MWMWVSLMREGGIAVVVHDPTFKCVLFGGLCLV